MHRVMRVDTSFFFSLSLSISFLCSVSLQPHQLKCCCRFILPFSNNSIISPLGFYHKKLLNRGPSAHPVRCIWGLEREKVYFHCIISKRPPLNSRIKKLFHSSLLCLLCVCVCVSASFPNVYMRRKIQHNQREE